jgi:hypothetical protein
MANSDMARCDKSEFNEESEMMVQILRICFDSMEAEEGSAPHVSFIKEIRQDFRSGASPLGYTNSSFLIKPSFLMPPALYT